MVEDVIRNIQLDKYMLIFSYVLLFFAQTNKVIKKYIIQHYVLLFCISLFFLNEKLLLLLVHNSSDRNFCTGSYKDNI